MSVNIEISVYPRQLFASLFALPQAHCLRKYDNFSSFIFIYISTQSTDSNIYRHKTKMAFKQILGCCPNINLSWLKLLHISEVTLTCCFITTSWVTFVNSTFVRLSHSPEVTVKSCCTQFTQTLDATTQKRHESHKGGCSLYSNLFLHDVFLQADMEVSFTLVPSSKSL